MSRMDTNGGGVWCSGLMGLILAGYTLFTMGCSPYDIRHENQWNSRDQIWLSEASQVKVRAAQTRVFDTVDRRKLLEAVVATMQDVEFRLDVLDTELGIVSGKKYVDLERPDWTDASYLLYRPDQLLFLTRNYRSWGPFWNRDDLVRFTVTIRQRGESQLVVRASAQFYLRAVETPEIYQPFFRALEQALFLHARVAP